MADGSGVSFQFHGSPEELGELARTWRDGHRLRLAGEQFFPTYQVVALDAWDGSNGPLETIDRLALREATFDLSASTTYVFALDNPGALFIQLGQLLGDQLEEAHIWAASGDPGTAPSWRQMVRRLRDGSHKGATVRNWATSAHKPSHRHMADAHRLAERGVRMVSHKDGPEYLFDDLQPPRS